jgi:hypothetical protein
MKSRKTIGKAKAQKLAVNISSDNLSDSDFLSINSEDLLRLEEEKREF